LARTTTQEIKATKLLVAEILAAVRKFDGDQRSQKILAAKVSQRNKGIYCGGKIPFGFSLDEDSKILVRNDAEQEVIVSIDMLRSSGLSCAKVAAKIKELHGIEMNRQHVRGVYERYHLNGGMRTRAPFVKTQTREGLTMPKGKKDQKFNNRTSPYDRYYAGKNDKIWLWYSSGKTMEATGRKYRVTKARVQQIISARASMEKLPRAEFGMLKLSRFAAAWLKKHFGKQAVTKGEVKRLPLDFLKNQDGLGPFTSQEIYLWARGKA
jgi:hypothetical protein